MKERFSACLPSVRAFLLTPTYSLLAILLACLFLFLDLPVYGICALTLWMTAASLLTQDMIPMLLPLLLCFCLAPLSIRNAQIPFADVAFAVIPAVLALTYRVVRYRRKIRLGVTFPGLCAVALAVTLGGLGCLSAEEYFSLGALYHVLGLGVGAVALYILFATDSQTDKPYHVPDRVASAAYGAALFLILTVLRCFLLDPRFFTAEGRLEDLLVWNMPWRNTATTLATMLMPFLFYYARKHHPVHLLTAVLLFLTMVATGSRSALVCGGLMLFFGFIYYLYRRPGAVYWIIGGVVGMAVLAFVFRDLLASFATRFIRLALPGSMEDIQNEPRALLARRAFGDFVRYPVFGTGFGYLGNRDCFAPTDTGWQVYWYHSAIPQIVGGLGLGGLLAYGYQFFLRLRALWRAPRNAYTVTLALSYLGLILYSQIDTGIFNPLPFAAMAVLLFVLLERETARAQRL